MGILFIFLSWSLEVEEYFMTYTVEGKHFPQIDGNKIFSDLW